MPLCVANLRGHIHKSQSLGLSTLVLTVLWSKATTTKKKTYKVRVCYKQTFRFTVISHYHR